MIAGAERHPLVVLPVARRPARRAPCSSASTPAARIARCDPGRGGDRLRHLLLDGDRRARRHPPHRGHALHDRRARRRARASAAREISEAFVAGGLKCPVETRIRDQIWLKLIGNVAFNPVSALTGATLGELGTMPEMVELLRAILEECAAVAARARDRAAGLDRAPARGRARGRRPQDLDAAGPRGRQAARARLHDRRRRSSSPTGSASPVPHTAAVHACAKLLERLRTAA